jgi:CBS domain-containing protein
MYERKESEHTVLCRALAGGNGFCRENVMYARDVMTEGVQCIPPTATIQKAAIMMQSLDVGALPVCDKDRLIGMITDRDIAMRSAAQGHDPMLEIVRDSMTPRVVYCFEDQDVSEVAQIMRDRQVRRIPVLNREKRLVGMISLGDLAIETDGSLSAHALKGISEPALAAP